MKKKTMKQRSNLKVVRKDQKLKMNNSKTTEVFS